MDCAARSPPTWDARGPTLPEAPTPDAQAPSILRDQKTCWRTAPAGRFSVIVDATDYFAAARDAILQAERAIYLIGWDFELRIVLVHQVDGLAPTKLGEFLKHLVKEKLTLRV